MLIYNFIIIIVSVCEKMKFIVSMLAVIGVA